MQFRRQSRHEEHINLTPLIDVVFLLLIFFMVSTTFTKETHLEIDLPEASVEPQEIAVADAIDITIRENGDYSINGKALVNQQAATLSKALKLLLNQKTSMPVTIIADANASHQSVVRAMDVVGQLGISQLRITTQQPVEE